MVSFVDMNDDMNDEVTPTALSEIVRRGAALRDDAAGLV
jgi:hypothetical protein